MGYMGIGGDIFMIRLVKHKRSNAGDMVMFSEGYFEIKDDGLIIHFEAKDNRKPSYAVALDAKSLKAMMDEIK